MLLMAIKISLRCDFYLNQSKVIPNLKRAMAILAWQPEMFGIFCKTRFEEQKKRF
jgi:hypothetical protein